MEVTQVYSLVNEATKSAIGESAIVAEDLSNVVDIGKEVLSSEENSNKFMETLVDRIGRTVFVDRLYDGSAPDLLIDDWTYGSIKQKIHSKMPEATEAPAWQLVKGQSYSPFTYNPMEVSQKFFDGLASFEINESIPTRQLYSSFVSASAMGAFTSMLQTNIKNSATVKTDALIRSTVNSMIGQTLYNEFPDITDGNYSLSSGIKAVNLLKLYNDKYGTTLTAENAITNPEFIRFSVLMFTKYMDRMKVMSTLFNGGKTERFTPTSRLGAIMHSEFKAAADVYLQSDTFHNEYTALPSAYSNPYWQGTGTDFGFASTSDIHVNIKDPANTSSNIEIIASGIIAAFYDKEALGVNRKLNRAYTEYVKRGDFYNYFFEYTAGYFNDLNENFVVFFVA